MTDQFMAARSALLRAAKMARSTSVIVGVGEITDRPDNHALLLEALVLMAEALRQADADAGSDMLGRIGSVPTAVIETGGSIRTVNRLALATRMNS